MTLEEGDEEARRAAEAVARRSYFKLIAFLAARTRDLAAAEDALSEAFASALSDWSRHGCPANPEAWLLTVARRKVIDGGRRRVKGEEIAEEIRRLTDGRTEDSPSDGNAIPDKRLALMFVCAHPAIDAPARAPLMLQIVLGFDARTIASAFLTSPSAMSKRLVRAKEKIRRAGIPFLVPEHSDLASRLDAVLDAIYATFAEGWTDPGATDVARRGLTDEALFLARLITGLLPAEPEPLGLLALMLHADARRVARRDAAGDFVPLAKQDHRQWNWTMIGEAETLLRQAATFGTIGRFQLEGALQSAHVYRCRTGKNNWGDVIHLYDALARLAPSPVIAINRAIAIAEVENPRAGLAALPDPSADPRLAEYQPYWAARAELLGRVGERDGAHHAYDIAIGLERDEAVRRFLQGKQSALR